MVIFDGNVGSVEHIAVLDAYKIIGPGPGNAMLMESENLTNLLLLVEIARNHRDYGIIPDGDLGGVSNDDTTDRQQ